MWSAIAIIVGVALFIDGIKKWRLQDQELDQLNRRK